MIRPMSAEELAYLTPEARARVVIDRMLAAAGWVVQDARAVSLAASRGVAVVQLRRRIRRTDPCRPAWAGEL
jgi:hypothetical protein